jgi:hypothetical protein
MEQFNCKQFDCYVSSDALQHAYSQLSLSFDSSQRSNISSFNPQLRMDFLWRLLIELLLDELDNEQRIQHLERCWVLNDSRSKTKPANLLQSFWRLIR